jgi:hypothetical protein
MKPQRRNRNGPRRGMKRNVVPYGNVIPKFSPSGSTFRMNLEVSIGKITTTVTTGLIALATAIQAGLVSNFNSRFGTTFDEYLIESFDLYINMCSSSNPGVINFWFETQSTSSPSAADATNNKTKTISAGSNEKQWRLHFNPRNAVTQAWTPISTTTAPIGYLKTFTNNSTFASSVVATDYAVLTGTLHVAFRGWA